MYIFPGTMFSKIHIRVLYSLCVAFWVGTFVYTDYVYHHAYVYVFHRSTFMKLLYMYITYDCTVCCVVLFLRHVWYISDK